MDYINSYYSQTRAETGYASLDYDLDLDVCVVGGGLAGLNTAYALAKAGKRVAVIEANRIAWGASGRNGGFVSGGMTLGTDYLERKLGLEQSKAIYKMSLDAVELVRQRAEEFKSGPFDLDCQVTHGMLEGHLWDQSEGAADDLASHNEIYGSDYEYWSAKDVQNQYHTKAYKGGVFSKSAFHFHPLNYSIGMARLASEAGVQIFEQSPVLKITDRKDGVTLQTEKAKIKAAQIVLTCSGYIKNLYPKLSRATMPITTYVMVTEPLGDRLASQVTDKPYAVIDERISCDYWRPLPDGSTRLLWGGRITAFPSSPDKVAQIMRKCMLRIYPELADVRIETAWSGKMGYARHRMPMIGKINDQVWYNTGFGGHGMAPTTMGGEVIARAMASGDEDYRLFETFGLPYAGSFLGPIAAQSYYVMEYLKDEFKIWRG